MRLPASTASRLSGAADPFIVELERFQGPLDLLLHLIRSQDIDIFDIPIAQITEQFIAAIQQILEGRTLERAGEFLEMAATLVRIKAQLLLPTHGEFLEEDPRTELVRRLLDYERFREIAYGLADAEADRAAHFGKGYIRPRPTPTLVDIPLELELGELLDVALSLPSPPARRPHQAPVRAITVDEKIALWIETLKKKVRVPFESFTKGWKGRLHAVMSFLACLELAKRGQVVLRQERHFGPLWIFKSEHDPDR